jgi:hypothetical protein
MKAVFDLAATIIAWAWTAFAGGGGLWLLFTLGPWPPTNGWFAIMSGVAACPLTAWALNRYANIRVYVWMQLLCAAILFIAGHLALEIWPHH